MRRFQFAAIALLIVTAPSAELFAQFFVRPDYYRPSTVAESHARGFADVVRARGQANLLNSEAAKNYEEARSKYLDNRLKATNTYFHMRAINRQARAAERGPRPTSEQLFRISKSRTPQRLQQGDFDSTGKLNWPALLATDAFKAEREQIDVMFASRASTGQLSPEQHLSVQRLTNTMIEQLKKDIKTLPPQTYTDSRSFLKRLANEARYTT